MERSDRFSLISGAASDAGFLLPTALCIGLLGGYGPLSAVILFVVYSFFGLDFRGRDLFSTLVLFLTYNGALLKYGHFTAALSLLCACVIVFVISSFRLSYLRSLLSDPVVTGFNTGAALLMIIMMTTYYFDIGARGIDAVSMLLGYRYNGFLPNWSTMLFGTITLVVCITFHRRFKKAGAVVSSAFLCVAGTSLLSLVLYPDLDENVFPTLGSKGFFDGYPWHTGVSFSVDAKGLFASSFTLAIIMLVCELLYHGSDKRSLRTAAVGNAICALAGVFPFGGRFPSFDEKPFSRRALCAAFGLAFFFVSYPLLRYLPLSVPAVIMITGIFRTLDYRAVLGTMRGGVRSIVIFIGCTVLQIILGIPFTALYMALITSVVVAIGEFMTKGGKNGREA